MNKLIIVLGVVFLSGCTTQPAYAPNLTSKKVDVIERGGVGVLSANRAQSIQWLAWPQTYRAMTGTYGYANRSTTTADIYKILGSDQEVWVYYSGAQATGFSIK